MKEDIVAACSSLHTPVYYLSNPHRGQDLFALRGCVRRDSVAGKRNELAQNTRDFFLVVKNLGNLDLYVAASDPFDDFMDPLQNAFQ